MAIHCSEKLTVMQVEYLNRVSKKHADRLVSISLAILSSSSHIELSPKTPIIPLTPTTMLLLASSERVKGPPSPQPLIERLTEKHVRGFNKYFKTSYTRDELEVVWYNAPTGPTEEQWYF